MLTDRLDLRPLTAADVDDVFAIMSDPAVWVHRPDLVHTDRATTADWVARAARRWHTDGLSYWLARARNADTDSHIGARAVLGIGGVQRQATGNWNLHYRLTPVAWGHGYATELSRASIAAARAADPGAAVVAWIADNNPASIRVAERVGLSYRGTFRDPSDGQSRRAYTDRPTDTLEVRAN